MRGACFQGRRLDCNFSNHIKERVPIEGEGEVVLDFDVTLMYSIMSSFLIMKLTINIKIKHQKNIKYLNKK